MVPSIDDKALSSDTTQFGKAFVREGKHPSFLDSPITEQLEAKEIARLDIVRFAKGDIERHEAVREVLEIYGDM